MGPQAGDSIEGAGRSQAESPAAETRERSGPPPSMRPDPGGGLSLVTRRDTPSPGHNDSYVVKMGDTLAGIAMQVYGNPQRWVEIFEANRDRIANPKRLPVGETFLVPRL